MVNFFVLITLVDAEVRPDDSFKFHYVFKGPKKDGKVKRLYYVYGTHLSAKDEGIKQEPYRPVGKGYNWPESYRKANNLYYELTFPEQGKISFRSDYHVTLLSNICKLLRSFFWAPNLQSGNFFFFGEGKKIA